MTAIKSREVGRERWLSLQVLTLGSGLTLPERPARRLCRNNFARGESQFVSQGASTT
jgi:hypothetical protein